MGSGPRQSPVLSRDSREAHKRGGEPLPPCGHATYEARNTEQHSRHHPALTLTCFTKMLNRQKQEDVTESRRTSEYGGAATAMAQGASLTGCVLEAVRWRILRSKGNLLRTGALMSLTPPRRAECQKHSLRGAREGMFEETA